MLKRILSLLLLLTLLATAVSCSFGRGPAATEAPSAPSDPLDAGDVIARLNKNKNVTVGRTDLVFDLTRKEVDELYRRFAELDRLIAEGTDYEAFDLLYTEISETDLERIKTQNEIIYLLWCCDLSDRLTEAAHLALDEIHTDLVARLNRTYETVWQSPFRDAFYDGWTDEEIAYVRALAAGYTDEMTALTRANDELLVAFRALSDEDETYYPETARLFLEMAKNNDRIARLLGYDDYMEYAYAEIYGRDYAPADTAAFRACFREGLMPRLSAYAEKIGGDGLSYLSLSFTDYWNFYRYFAGDVRSDFSDVVARYASAVGVYAPAYLTTYEEFFGKKNYCFAGGDAYEGAFTTYLSDAMTPVIYFGPGYASPDAFIHEFGHYFVAVQNGSEAELYSYDLAETQSQGNEFLFTWWFENNEPSYRAIAQAVAEYKEYEILVTVLVASLVNDFEIYVYTHLDELTPEELDGVLVSLCDGYGGYGAVEAAMGYAPEWYWHHVVMEAPGYYISYAISAIPTLSLYAKARAEGFAAAVAAYDVLANADPETGFLETLKAAGIGSPFDAATYRAISSQLAPIQTKDGQ